MNKTIYFLLLLFAFAPCIAKGQGCDALIKDARTLAKKLQFDDAIKKVEAAKGCAAQADIDKLYSEIFAGLKTQNREAIEAKDKAKKDAESIRALLIQVEREKQDANKAKDRAEKEAEKTRLALAELQKAVAEKQAALTDIAKRNIRDAQNQIYHLDYEGALATLQSAAALQSAQKEVSDAMLEIVFFFAETGKFDRAKGVLDTAAQIIGRTLTPAPEDWGVHTSFRTAIKSLNPEREAFFTVRYFPTMLSIPGGTYSTDSDNDSDPQPVTLPSFKLAQTETTWWQYNLFVEATQKKDVLITSNRLNLGGDIPVSGTTWYDAIEYANWLSVKDGFGATTVKANDYYSAKSQIKGYRLPTAVEWEYAASIDSLQELVNIAWLSGQNGNSMGQIHPVGKKISNQFGLFDMVGNVSEWCGDCKEVKATPPNKDFYMCAVRGGSWQDPLGNFGRWYKKDLSPNDKSTFKNGFRLAQNQ